MPKDKEKMTKEEKIVKATELIGDLNALELSDDDIKLVAGGHAMSDGMILLMALDQSTRRKNCNS